MKAEARRRNAAFRATGAIAPDAGEAGSANGPPAAYDAPELRRRDRELLDQDRLRLHLGQKPRGEAAQLLGIFRQGQGLIEHVGSLSHCIPCGNH